MRGHKLSVVASLLFAAATASVAAGRPQPVSGTVPGILSAYARQADPSVHAFPGQHCAPKSVNWIHKQALNDLQLGHLDMAVAGYLMHAYTVAECTVGKGGFERYKVPAIPLDEAATLVGSDLAIATVIQYKDHPLAVMQSTRQQAVDAYVLLTSVHSGDPKLLRQLVDTGLAGKK